MGKAWSLGVARTTTWWCSRCGVNLAAAPASGARSSRCAFCRHRGTHVEHQRGAAGERAMSQVPDPIASPPPLVLASGELPPSYPRGCGKKRALLVGVSYTGTKYELRGTANDVKEMRDLLRKQFGFPDGCILELTEKETDPYRVPTRANLLLAMRWLVEGTSSGDSLVFHFSGHGVQKLDFQDDEVDGYDEALCPVDFEVNGKILDDDINDAIVRPLVKGVKLHAIVDTCHSGTILDLPYLCRMSRTGYWQWENHCRPSRKPKRPSEGGLAISISGCSDDQKSVDNEFSGEQPIGAMTDSFIKAVKAEPGTTYGRLLSTMRARIRDGHGNPRLPGRLGSFVRRMIVSTGVQEPQLCSSEVFDIYRKPFLL